jgi:hypothetical protein
MTDREFKKIKRQLQHARREIIKATARAAKTDLRRDHYVIAARLAREVRDEADRAIREFS